MQKRISADVSDIRLVADEFDAALAIHLAEKRNPRADFVAEVREAAAGEIPFDRLFQSDMNDDFLVEGQGGVHGVKSLRFVGDSVKRNELGHFFAAGATGKPVDDFAQGASRAALGDFFVFHALSVTQRA